MVGEDNNGDQKRQERLDLAKEFAIGLLSLVNNEERRELAAPILEELLSVIQLVAVEVLEIRSSRAIRNVLGLPEPVAAN